MFSTVLLVWSLGVNHNGVLMVLEGWRVVWKWWVICVKILILVIVSEWDGLYWPLFDIRFGLEMC